MTPHQALSTRSRAYKELGLAGREIDDAELLDLMVEEPTLLRRPLVLGERGAVLGFDRERLRQLME